MAMIISLDSDEGSSFLRRSLKERSTVAVDTGSTIAMESRVLMFGEGQTLCLTSQEPCYKFLQQ